MACDLTGYEIILDELDPDGSETATVDPICYDRLAIHRFMAKGINTKNETYCNVKQVNWYWPIYYGVSTAEHETEANIVLMNKTLRGPNWKSGTWSIDGGGYKYIAVPDIYEKPLTIKEKETGFGLAVAADAAGYTDGASDIFSHKELILTNVYGVSKVYRVYRSTNFLNSPINLLIT